MKYSTAPTSHAQIAGNVFERRQLGSPRAIDASEPRHTSSRTMNGITHQARGMNQPPMAHPGPSLGFWRPSASLFFAARYSQMISSTKIAIVTSPLSITIDAGNVCASFTALVLKTNPPCSWSFRTVRWWITPMINNTDNPMWTRNSTVSALVRPRRLRHCAVGAYPSGGVPQPADGAPPCS
jgi:hypothetical protein